VRAVKKRHHNDLIWIYEDAGKRNVRCWRSGCGSYYIHITPQGHYRGTDLRISAASSRTIDDTTFEAVADRLTQQAKAEGRGN